MRYHIMYSNKGDRCMVYIASSYRNEDGKPRKKIFRKCGNKQALLAEDPNAIAKIQEEVERLNEKAQVESLRTQLLANDKIYEEVEEQLKSGLSLKGETPVLRSLGLELLSRLWDQLNLSYKLNYIKKSTKAEFNFTEVVRQLVLAGILMPCSKARTCRLLPQSYLGAAQIDLSHFYASLDILAKNKDSIIKYLNKRLNDTIEHRDTHICLYDITTYAFESMQADSLRDFDYSKDKKFNEVQVLMALASDKEGIPFSYSLYSGNQGESPTMVLFVEDLKSKYGVEHLVVVADRGLNNNANIDALVSLGHDYVLSSRIRSASDDVKKAALDPTGRVYKDFVDEDGVVTQTWFKELKIEQKVSYKLPEFVSEDKTSRLPEQLCEDLKTHKTKAGNDRRKSVLKRRLIITFSEKRKRKDQADRARLIKKANKLVENPSLYASDIKRGGKSLVCAEFDRNSLAVNTKLIEEQEKFDGLHVVETSLESPADEVLGIYQELRHIENNFRVMKSQLVARPVFVRTEEHIRGHFLCCYLALTITRLLEQKLRKQGTPVSIGKLVDGLNNLQTMRIKLEKLPAIYATTGKSKEVSDICRALGVEIPEDYESAATYRKKLSLLQEASSYFKD